MSKKKDKVNLVVIGHVGAGKSTVAGHLLAAMGGVDKKTVEACERDSKDAGKASFKFAWITDKTKAERERGVTMDISTNHFETPSTIYTIIDAPGHRHYVKNMVNGTQQADAVLLVVSAAKGEFEAGFAADGQTRLHALLAASLGVNQMVVAINKMDDDNPKYQQARFAEIVSLLGRFLHEAGYPATNVTYIPISGMTGENLVPGSPVENLTWHKGGTLVAALDARIKPVRRSVESSLRVPIGHVYHIGGIGTVVAGRIESGTIRADQPITLAPVAGHTSGAGTTPLSGEAKSLRVNGIAATQAAAGDNIGVGVTKITGGDEKQIVRGMVMGDGKDIPQSVSSFTAQITILNHRRIHEGYTPVIDVHQAHVACRFSQLLARLDKRTNAQIEAKPKELQNGGSYLVELQPTKPLVCDVYATHPSLGRFTIRDINRIIGVGTIKSVRFGPVLVTNPTVTRKATAGVPHTAAAAKKAARVAADAEKKTPPKA